MQPPAKVSNDTVRLTIEGELLSIPVSVYLATTDDYKPATVSTSPAGNPVGLRYYDKVTMEDIEHAQVSKQIVTDHGNVSLSTEEREQAMDLDAKSLTIHGFYPRAMLGTVFLPKAYRHLAPAEQRVGKRKVPDQKARAEFSGLLIAMAQAGRVAYGELVSRGRPAPVVLLPTGELWEVHYLDSLRHQDTGWWLTDETKIGQMGEYVMAHATDDTPDLTDHHTERLVQFARAKAQQANLVLLPNPAADQQQAS